MLTNGRKVFTLPVVSVVLVANFLSMPVHTAFMSGGKGVKGSYRWEGMSRHAIFCRKPRAVWTYINLNYL